MQAFRRPCKASFPGYRKKIPQYLYIQSLSLLFLYCNTVFYAFKVFICIQYMYLIFKPIQNILGSKKAFKAKLTFKEKIVMETNRYLEHYAPEKQLKAIQNCIK